MAEAPMVQEGVQSLEATGRVRRWTVKSNTKYLTWLEAAWSNYLAGAVNLGMVS